MNHRKLLSLILGLILSRAAFSDPTPCQLKSASKCSEMVYALREIPKLLQFNYSYYDENFLNNEFTKAKIQGAENQIMEDTDEATFFRILSNIAASLRDGHIKIFYNPGILKKTVAPFQLRTMNFLNSTGLQSTETILTSVPSKGSFNNFNYQIGDVVLQIWGQKVNSLARQAFKETSASTIPMRHAEAANRLAECYGDLCSDIPLDLKVSRYLNLEKLKETPENLRIGELPSPFDIRAERHTYEGKTIGYVRIDRFERRNQEVAFQGMLDSMKGIEGLVLDLRFNTGGDAYLGDRLLGLIMPEPIESIVRYYYYKKTGSKSFSPMQSWVVNKDLTSSYFRNIPIAVLTGPLCFSSCHTLVSAIKLNHLAILMGESTGGGSGMPALFKLGRTEFSISLPTARVFDGSMSLIEGNGVTTHFILQPSLEDLVSLIDSVKVKALNFVAHRSGVN